MLIYAARGVGGGWNGGWGGVGGGAVGGGVGVGVGGRNHTLGYAETEGQIVPLAMEMGQNQTLGRICHQINQFWSNFVWNRSNLAQILSFASKNKNGGIRSKWPKFAENIPLATEAQPRLDP